MKQTRTRRLSWSKFIRRNMRAALQRRPPPPIHASELHFDKLAVPPAKLLRFFSDGVNNTSRPISETSVYVTIRRGTKWIRFIRVNMRALCALCWSIVLPMQTSIKIKMHRTVITAFVGFFIWIFMRALGGYQRANTDLPSSVWWQRVNKYFFRLLRNFLRLCTKKTFFKFLAKKILKIWSSCEEQR